MPVTQDIVATYKGPGRVMSRLLDMGPREDRALVIVMAACVVLFIARWPALARQAHLEGAELQANMAGALFGTVFILPLVLYVLAFAIYALSKPFRMGLTAYEARITLFWALLASSPLALLNGLVAGFIGPGPSLTLVGILWLGVLLWFWIRGLMAAVVPPSEDDDA